MKVFTKIIMHASVCIVVTYDDKISPSDPEALFQQKIPQVYLELQEKIQTIVVNMKKIDKPPVMRSDEFR